MTDEKKLDDWDELDVEGDVDAAKALSLDSVSLAEVPEFPVGALNGPIAAFADWGLIDGLHAEAVAPAAIGAVSSLLGNVFHSGAPRVMPSVWIALIGTRSSGKSPAMAHAFETMKEIQHHEPPIILTDATCAAVPQEMSDANGSICILADELAGFLSGLSGAGQNGDTQSAQQDLAFFRSCWSGAYIRRTRVSTGTIVIPHPHLSIVGGLLPGRINQLGSSIDGDSPRWLPSLVPNTTPVAPSYQQPKPSLWLDTLHQLRDIRGTERQWQLRGDGWEVYNKWRKEWTARQNSDLPEHVQSGLSKAADQAARMAIVFAEAAEPGRGGVIGYSSVESACQIVDYHMKCWEAIMPPRLSVLATGTDARARARGVAELTDLIMQLTPDEDGLRKITKRRLMQRCVGGIKEGNEMDKLIGAYEKVNPGTIEREDVRGGRERVTVREPFRKNGR